MARPHLRPTWTRRLPLRWPKSGNCNQVSSASCTRTPDCWHRSLRAALSQLLFSNTAQVSCRPSTQFWMRVWRVVGFIVIATNHPPDSLISVFPDGHELKFTPYWPAEADRRTQGVAIGKFADEVLVADVRFVLDQLQEINSHDHFWHSHLDLSKVGIVGHSMGGTTAALATKEEPRILAGVNLDGSTYPGMNADVRPIPVHKPFLFLATEEHASGESRSREYVGSESNTYYVVVTRVDHMSFTDAHLVSSRFA